MKIGILGGTFDPIHLGHLTLARYAQVFFSLDKVLFIPAYKPPHKQAGPARTSAKDRYAMVRLAIHGEPFFEISDCEIRRKGISYTCDTITELKEKYPHDTLHLILGQDAFEDFETWRKASEIAKEVRFLVARRTVPGARKKMKTGVKWIRMPLCPITSSRIREALAEGQDLKDQIPEAVLRYLWKHKLYRKTGA